jgi:hypothetical protein
MPQPVDVTQLAPSVEDLLRPFTGQAEGFWERAKQLYNLRNVVVVLAILGAGLRVEEVVASDELKNLQRHS